MFEDRSSNEQKKENGIIYKEKWSYNTDLEKRFYPHALRSRVPERYCGENFIRFWDELKIDLERA